MNGDWVEMETLHFHDKTIVQVFPADREIRISGDKARLYKQGKLIKEIETPLIAELEKLQDEIRPHLRDYTNVQRL